MKLLSMRVEDFCCFGKFELTLENMGLVWISGNNNDTQAAGNNGSGKSTVFKALTWCLFGKTIDGERGDKVIRDGCSKAFVSVSLSDGKKAWEVVRERKRGSPGIKLICPDGCDYKGDKNEIQTRVEQLLGGLDFLSFKNSVLYGQNDSSRFIRPETSDADRKMVLHKILGTDLLTETCGLARKKKKIEKDKLVQVESVIQTLEARLGDIGLEELERLEKQFDDEIEQESNKKLKQAQAYAADAKKQVSKLKALKRKKRGVQSVNAIEKRIKKTQKDIKSKKECHREKVAAANKVVSTLQNELSLCGEEATAAAKDIKHLQGQLNRLDGERCSVCNSPLDKGVAGKYIKKLGKELSAAIAESDKLTQARKVLDGKLRDAKGKYNRATYDDGGLTVLEQTLNSLARELGEIKSSDARDGAEKKSLADKVARLKSLVTKELGEHARLQSKENRYTGMLVEAKKKQKTLEKALKKASKERMSTLKKFALLEFWSKGFSNQGLPSFLLDSVVPYIAERANHYLGILSDHDIKLNLSTQSELKSGENRDKIDISWEIEGVKDSYPPSGGQWKKMEIATDLALMDLVSNKSDGDLGLLALDEILDGLDAEGKSRVADLLIHLREHKRTIFVITHDPDVADVFERTVVVEKTDGVSSLQLVS